MWITVAGWVVWVCVGVMVVRCLWRLAPMKGRVDSGWRALVSVDWDTNACILRNEVIVKTLAKSGYRGKDVYERGSNKQARGL